MKRILTVAGLLILTVFVLAACNRNRETEAGFGWDGWTPDDIGPTTIRMAWWGGDARHNAINAALDLFQDRYPHIEIVREYGAFGPYLDALIVQLADGSEPDVFQSNYAWVHMLADGNNPYMDLNRLNHIIDLGEWSDALLARTITADGQLSSVPHGITGRVIIYDTEMLRAAGRSTFPATFDEWISLAETVNAGNTALDTPGNNYAFWPLGAPNNDLSMDIIIMTMIYNHFGVNLHANGRILPTIDQVEYVFNILQRMKDVGLLPTHEQQEGVTDAFNPVWMEGRGGSVFEWVSNIHLAGGAMETAVVDPAARRVEGFGVALLPAVAPGGSRLSLQRPSIVHAVGPNTEHPALAAYLLNWLYTDEQALRTIFDQFGIPLSNTAARIFQDMGGAWGLMLDGFDLLEANEAIMCAFFEDANLRPHRLRTIEAFRRGDINARDAATQWVNNQQYGLDNR
jgi:oligogalacturonide transport system substrate-binding protein